MNMESYCLIITNKDHFHISVALKRIAKILLLHVTVILTGAERYATLWIHGSKLLNVHIHCTFLLYFCNIESLRTKPASLVLRLPLFRLFRQERGWSLRKRNKNIYEIENKRKETHDTPRPRQPHRARANRRQALNNILLLLYHIVRVAW